MIFKKMFSLMLIVLLPFITVDSMASSNYFNQDYITQNPVYKIDTQESIDALSTIIRNKYNIGFNFDARELAPGNVYTLWIMNFDKPWKCIDRCSCNLDDFKNPKVTGGAMGAMTGRVADQYGQINMSTVIDYGVLPTGEGQVLVPNPIKNKRAHIMLVLRDHGKASEDPTILEEQLTSWGGGCDTGSCNDAVVSDHPSPILPCLPSRFEFK